jgi:hypothetical protein
MLKVYFYINLFVKEIVIFPFINFTVYKPTILRIMKYKPEIKTKLKEIKNKRNLGVLNKFLNGVIITNINPIILLIKNRGYLIILVQKLFIKIIIIKSFLFSII